MRLTRASIRSPTSGQASSPAASALSSARRSSENTAPVPGGRTAVTAASFISSYPAARSTERPTTPTSSATAGRCQGHLIPSVLVICSGDELLEFSGVSRESKHEFWIPNHLSKYLKPRNSCGFHQHTIFCSAPVFQDCCLQQDFRATINAQLLFVMNRDIFAILHD